LVYLLSCCFQILIQYSFGNSIFFHCLYLSKQSSAHTNASKTGISSREQLQDIMTQFWLLITALQS
jgi:hypothetical protein